MSTFSYFSGGKSPAGTAATLVLDGADNTLISPVDVHGIGSEGTDSSGGRVGGHTGSGSVPSTEGDIVASASTGTVDGDERIGARSAVTSGVFTGVATRSAGSASVGTEV